MGPKCKTQQGKSKDKNTEKHKAEDKAEATEDKTLTWRTHKDGGAATGTQETNEWGENTGEQEKVGKTDKNRKWRVKHDTWA